MDTKRLVHVISRLKRVGQDALVAELIDVEARFALSPDFIPDSEESLLNFFQNWKTRLDDGRYEEYASIVRSWVSLLRNPTGTYYESLPKYFKTFDEKSFMVFMVAWFNENGLVGWLEPIARIPEQVCHNCGLCCGSMDLGPIPDADAARLEAIELVDPIRKTKGHYIKRVIRTWAKWSAGGVCLYLTEDHHCSIYDTRPDMCRNWSCRQY